MQFFCELTTTISALEFKNSTQTDEVSEDTQGTAALCSSALHALPHLKWRCVTLNYITASCSGTFVRGFKIASCFTFSLSENE